MIGERNTQELCERLRIRRAPTVPFFFPDWLLTKEIARFVRAAIQRFGDGALLDVGCGERPFEAYRTQKITQWTGVDVPGNAKADIHAFAHDIPVASGTFKTILCTEVLEHVPNPKAVVDELFRVLAPGGHLILTVPQYWPLHEEPYDFFRFTSYGLRHVLEESGFAVIEQSAAVSGIKVAAVALNLSVFSAAEKLPGGRTPIGRMPFAIVYLLSNVLALMASPLIRDEKNYLSNQVVAKKPL